LAAARHFARFCLSAAAAARYLVAFQILLSEDRKQPMIIAVAKETFPGERRVALVPGVIASLTKVGLQVKIQAGAGEAAGFRDADFVAKGAEIVASREAVFDADCVLQVRALGTNPQAALADLPLIKPQQLIIGLCDPLGMPQQARAIAERGATLFSLEMIPRITRAQSMDVLSSMATVAGYRAVLLAAISLPKMFPLLTTAAGTLTPAKVFIIGAGVAGLQAIASARRMGAVVSAYDARPAVKEQVQSLAAKFIELAVDTSQAEGQGGYAKDLGEETLRRQQEQLTPIVAQSDVVISTAAVPGKKAPVLITASMVAGMAAGSVIVDLAAERGGNCESTVAGETVVRDGVTIIGSTNLPSDVAYHASQMFAKNVTTFLLHLLKDGLPQFDMEDQITRDTLITRNGEIVHPRVKEALAASAGA
jgi:NAD(P) transhydrogenase subunit alpha